jgi:hypothetical protein
VIAKIPHLRGNKKLAFHQAVMEEARQGYSRLSGKDMKGRNLTVNEARPRTGGSGSRRY